MQQCDAIGNIRYIFNICHLTQKQIVKFGHAKDPHPGCRANQQQTRRKAKAQI